MAETLLYYKKYDGYGFHEENIIPAVSITVYDQLSPSNMPETFNRWKALDTRLIIIYKPIRPYGMKAFLTKLDCFLYPARTLKTPGIAN
jgi:hypothetical protein